MGAKSLAFLVSISLLLSVFMFQYSQINQREALLNQSFDRLKMFHSLRKASLEDYLDSVSSEIFAASLGSRTRTAVKPFKSAWKSIGGDPTSFLQTHYIIENLYPL